MVLPCQESERVVIGVASFQPRLPYTGGVCSADQATRCGSPPGVNRHANFGPRLGRIASSQMLPETLPHDLGCVIESARWRRWRTGSAWVRGGRLWRRRRTATGPARGGEGRILAELCTVTGWHRKHAVRVLRGVGVRPRTSRASGLADTAPRPRMHHGRRRHGLDGMFAAADA